MREPDHRHVDDHPGRIEQRQQPLRREQAAQGGDVAQALGRRAAAATRALRHGDARHRGRQGLGHHVAGHALQAAAQVVQREQQSERDANAQRQHEQRVAALAGEHAIEHLQHEDRRDQEQQVDEERQPGHVEQRASEQLQ